MSSVREIVSNIATFTPSEMGELDKVILGTWATILFDRHDTSAPHDPASDRDMKRIGRILVNQFDIRQDSVGKYRSEIEVQTAFANVALRDGIVQY